MGRAFQQKKKKICTSCTEDYFRFVLKMDRLLYLLICCVRITQWEDPRISNPQIAGQVRPFSILGMRPAPDIRPDSPFYIRFMTGYCKPDVRFGRSSKRSDIRPYRIPLQFSFLNRGQKLSASVLENANVHCGVTFIRDNMI